MVTVPKKFLVYIPLRLIALTQERTGLFFAQRIALAAKHVNSASILHTITLKQDLYLPY